MNYTHPEILEAEATGKTCRMDNPPEAYTRECKGCGEKGSKAEMIKDPECGLYYHPDCLWEWLLDSYPIIGQKIEQLRQIEGPK